jgi:beta-phosphoglucomutase
MSIDCLPGCDQGMQLEPASTMSQPMVELRAVIFDLDGVLVQTEDYHFQSWTVLANELNISCERAFYDRHLRGLGRADAIDIILANAGLTLTPEERNHHLDAKNELFLRLIATNPLPAAPGAEALLTSLRSCGLRIAVGSSSQNARLLLRQMEILEIFDAVVDGNDAPGKPDPAIFLRVAELLEMEPTECIVVEDAEEGVRAAQRAGMPVLTIGPLQHFSSHVTRVDALTEVTLEQLQEVHRQRIGDCPIKAAETTSMQRSRETGRGP